MGSNFTKSSVGSTLLLPWSCPSVRIILEASFTVGSAVSLTRLLPMVLLPANPAAHNSPQLEQFPLCRGICVGRGGEQGPVASLLLTGARPACPQQHSLLKDERKRKLGFHSDLLQAVGVHLLSGNQRIRSSLCPSDRGPRF